MLFLFSLYIVLFDIIIAILLNNVLCLFDYIYKKKKKKKKKILNFSLQLN